MAVAFSLLKLLLAGSHAANSVPLCFDAFAAVPLAT